MSDLFEYPPDHVGTRQYVSVRGYSRSIPRYKTYTGFDGYRKLKPEFGGEPEEGGTSAYYMPDKAPYVSPMDGSLISSRSTHREHMRLHGVEEAGDARPVRRPSGTWSDAKGSDIVNAIRKLGGN